MRGAGWAVNYLFRLQTGGDVAIGAGNCGPVLVTLGVLALWFECLWRTNGEIEFRPVLSGPDP